MTSHEADSDAWFDELAEQECLDLLASKHLGRVAYDDGGPGVLPGTYVTAMARSSFGPHRAARWAEARASVVAFEVDEIHEEAVSGWDVLLRGRAVFMAAPELPDMHPRPGPTIAGAQFLYPRSVPQLIRGRRLRGAIGLASGPAE